MELITVPENLKEKVRKTHNVTKKDIEKDVEILKEWMSKQPHLPQKLLFPNFVEQVLANRKFNVERTKESIENLFTLKTLYKDVFEYFKDYDYSLLKTAIPKVTPLRKFGPNNEQIALVSLRANVKPDFGGIAVIWLACLYMFIKYSYPTGVFLILDFQNLSFEYIRAIQIPSILKMIHLSLCGFGLKVNSVHTMNMSNLLEFGFKYTALLRPKLGKKVFHHKNLDSLLKHIPLKYLPIDMGGENGTIDEQTDEFISFLMSSKDELEQYAEMTTDDSVRIDQYMKANELFGCDGTFRQLKID